MDEIHNQEQQEQVQDVNETEVEEIQQTDEIIENKTYSQEEIDVLHNQIEELSQYKPKRINRR